jgi:hypothetical protein
VGFQNGGNGPPVVTFWPEKLYSTYAKTSVPFESAVIAGCQALVYWVAVEQSGFPRYIGADHVDPPVVLVTSPTFVELYGRDAEHGAWEVMAV